MKRNLADFFVALFVIACSIVLLAALTFALSGYHLKKPTRTSTDQLRRCDRRKGEFRVALRRRASGTRDRDASPYRQGA